MKINIELIPVNDKLPEKDEIVDVWLADGRRLTNYKYIRNYGNVNGNDFFEPVLCGYSCLRISDETLKPIAWSKIPKFEENKSDKKICSEKYDIEIIDYQYGYAEEPISGTVVEVNGKELLDIDNKEINEQRADILIAILNYFNIDANVNCYMDLD